ncbi:MAG: hypothetical protein HW387_1114 [Parachlamydiales bacterium]|nr:hypothetical protein [Parachlamydiales bacterium]
MKLYLWLKREFLHVIPVFIFFFIAFNIINVTEGLILKKAGIGRFSILEITLAAALIAKILLVLDHLPIVAWVPERPLIYHVIWKTLLYWLITLLVRLTMRLIPYLFTNQRLPVEWEQFVTHVDWPLFYSIQAWYLLLFFFFVTARELINVIGAKKINRIFFYSRD